MLKTKTLLKSELKILWLYVHVTTVKILEFFLCPQLLDINEQPIGGGRELKRRKKLAGNKSTHTVTLQLVTFQVLSEKSRGQSIIQLPTLM